MARVHQHGATPQRMPLADRPLKSRDRRAAHGNGTAFSAEAPSSGPYWPPVDPITREWYCPQARIAGPLTFQPVARFRPSGGFISIAQECGAFATYRDVSPQSLSRICTCMTAVRILLRTILAAIFGLLCPKSGNAALPICTRQPRQGGNGGDVVPIGGRSVCVGMTALAIGFAAGSLGQRVVGAASAGHRAESALLSVFESIRPKSLDHRASLVHVASLETGFAFKPAVEESE